MFGANSSNKESRKAQSGGTILAGVQSTNILVNGTRIEGSVFTESDIRIDGKVKGTIQSKGKVIIGASGNVEGDIQCQNAVIEGKFNGNLVISELLQVKETATIEGEVSTAKLLVHAGATFNVACKMGAQRIKETKREDAVPLEFGQLSKVARQ